MFSSNPKMKVVRTIAVYVFFGMAVVAMELATPSTASACCHQNCEETHAQAYSACSWTHSLCVNDCYVHNPVPSPGYSQCVFECDTDFQLCVEIADYNYQTCLDHCDE